MEEMKRWRSPAPEFCGFYGELPITHYFDHYAWEEKEEELHRQAYAAASSCRRRWLQHVRIAAATAELAGKGPVRSVKVEEEQEGESSMGSREGSAAWRRRALLRRRQRRRRGPPRRSTRTFTRSRRNSSVRSPARR